MPTPPPPPSTLFPYTTLFRSTGAKDEVRRPLVEDLRARDVAGHQVGCELDPREAEQGRLRERAGDRKSTRLNSSHLGISYAVFCLKKKKKKTKGRLPGDRERL